MTHGHRLFNQLAAETDTSYNSNIKRKISLPNFFHKCLDTNKENLLEPIPHYLDFILVFYIHTMPLFNLAFLSAIKLMFKITGTIMEDNLQSRRQFLKNSEYEERRVGSQLASPHPLSVTM
jgi:hypothetical protein